MIGATTVRQALDYVARGEVDAGFVYATDAALMPDKVKVAFTVPTETPVLYPIAPSPPARTPRWREVRRLRAVAAGAGGARASTASASPDDAGTLRRWRPPGSRSALTLKVALLGDGARTWCSASPSASRWRALRFPGRELLDSILLLPMVLPPTVLGYYLLVV